MATERAGTKSLSWQLPGVHLQHDENVLELAGANGSLSFVPGNNGAPLPTLELSFQRGKLATAEEQLGLGELTLYSTINRNQQGILSLVDADWQGGAWLAGLPPLADDKQFACSSVYLSMRWHDLEQQGVRELLSQLGNLKPDQAPVLAAINRITLRFCHRSGSLRSEIAPGGTQGRRRPQLTPL